MPKHSGKLKSSDAAMLVSFLQAQPEETKRFFHPFPLDIDSMSALLGDPRRHVCIMTQDERQIAVWLLTDIDSEMPEFGVMVDAGCRRQGLGDLCIRLAKATARQLGAKGLRISVYPDNEASIAMCSNAGFQFNGNSPDGQRRMEWRA